jgi:hypothetical protein
MSTALGENVLLVDLFCDNLRRYLAGAALRTSSTANEETDHRILRRVERPDPKRSDWAPSCWPTARLDGLPVPMEYLHAEPSPMATTTTRPVFDAQPSPAEIAARIAGYGAWLEIDLDAMGRNLERLRRRLGTGTTALTVNVLGDLIRDARNASARPARVGAA